MSGGIDRLSSAVGTLGSARTESGMTGVAALTDITDLAVAVTVPATTTKLRISGRFKVAGNAGPVIGFIREGSTTLTSGNYPMNASSNVGVIHIEHVIENPTPGAHTYKLSVDRWSGTVDVEASAVAPAWILVEDLTKDSLFQPVPLSLVDSPPGSPNAANYEFDASSTSLPSGWSWFNQGTSTYSEAYGIGSLDLQAGGSDEFRGVVRALPAGTTWIATFKAQAALRIAGGTLPSRGLVLRESSSGKFTVFSQFTNHGVVVDHYTNVTTYSSRPGASLDVFNCLAFPYVRVRRNSATSYDFAVSPDGGTWLTTHAAINVSTHITPDQIGIGVNTRGNAVSLGIDWYRVA